MTEHLKDHISLIQEMINLKSNMLKSPMNWMRKQVQKQLRDEVSILEEKKVEVESFIKSNSQNG